MRCISVVRSLCFRIFSAAFLFIFASPEVATYINIQSFFKITDYHVRFIVGDGSVGLLLLIPQYGCLAFLTDIYEFCTCLYECSLSIFTHISLRMLNA
jgi:hypothetical protein